MTEAFYGYETTGIFSYSRFCSPSDYASARGAYTSSLEETVEELKHCHDCPGIIDCQNRFDGHVLYPEKKGKQKNDCLFHHLLLN